jgi:uncharacterized protein YndB with AHSA1/START domain
MKITVETIIDAPLARVWEAYTAPSDITKWNFAMDTWHCPRATADLREGGAFSSRMEAKDGSFGFDFAGTYTKIGPHKLIAYSFGERSGTVEFLDGAKGVTVRSTFDAETQYSMEQQRDGWQAILNNFKKHVEATRDA